MKDEYDFSGAVRGLFVRRRCQIYDAPCINPAYCDAASAQSGIPTCCAGDHNCKPRSEEMPGGQWKAYDHVTGVTGNEGEDPDGALAFVANLDPNPNYPEARIVIGPPASQTISFEGGFALTYDKAGEVIDRLREIRRDMEIAGVVRGGARGLLAIEQAIHDLRSALQNLGYYADTHQHALKMFDALVTLVTGRK